MASPPSHNDSKGQGFQIEEAESRQRSCGEERACHASGTATDPERISRARTREVQGQILQGAGNDCGT